MNTEEQLYENLTTVIFEMNTTISKLIKEKKQLTQEKIDLTQEVEKLKRENTKLYQQIGIIAIEVHKQEQEDVTNKISVKAIMYCDADCDSCQGTAKYKEQKCWYARNVFIIDNKE